ncbi:MAG: hypothetical protein H5T68_13060 [Chloroflexi bacterium]|nr:hypothetical protein [Chloroflexota bacterium]
MERDRPITARVFPLDELDGFYVGDGKCVHISFESEDIIVIDLFDTEKAAYNGNAGGIIGQPILINLKTGEIELEK